MWISRKTDYASLAALERTTFAGLARRAGGPWIQHTIPVQSASRSRKPLPAPAR